MKDRLDLFLSLTDDEFTSRFKVSKQLQHHCLLSCIYQKPMIQKDIIVSYIN